MQQVEMAAVIQDTMEMQSFFFDGKRLLVDVRDWPPSTTHPAELPVAFAG